MSSADLLSLHQQLKQCFETLKANKSVWDSELAEPLMSSLGNLAVQFKALKNVQIANTPLASFPSLQKHLHYKLLLAVDAVLGKLAEKMDALQSVRDAISQQVSAVFQFYEKNTDTLDIAGCVSRSAICPSISDMLEWLQSLLPPTVLVQRRNLLQTLTPNDLTLMEMTPKKWESLHSATGEEKISVGSLWDSFKPPGFHPKYLKLCSEDERRFYGFGTTWGCIVSSIILHGD